MQLRRIILLVLMSSSVLNAADKLSTQEISKTRAMCDFWDHHKVYSERVPTCTWEQDLRKEKKEFREKESANRWYVSTWAEMSRNKSTGSTHELFGPLYVTSAQLISFAQQYIIVHSETKHFNQESKDRLEIVGWFLWHEAKKKGNIEERLKWKCNFRNEPLSQVDDYNKNKINLLIQYLKTGKEQYIDRADALYIDTLLDDPTFLRDLSFQKKEQYHKELKAGNIPLRHARVVQHLQLFPTSLSHTIHITCSSQRTSSSREQQEWCYGLFGMLRSGNITCLLPECKGN